MASQVQRFTVLAGATALSLVLSGCQRPEEKAADYVEEAVELRAEGDIEKANIQLRNALKLDARNVQAHLLMAEIAESGAEWPAMHNHLRQVVELDPQNVQALLKLAQLYLVGNDVERAGVQLAQLQQLEPGNARVMMIEGMVLARRGDRDGALAAAERAFAADGADRDITAGFASALLSAGQGERALAIVDGGLKARPGDDGLRLLRFRILAAGGKVEEASATLREYANSKPADLQVWRLLALYFARNDQPAKAEEVLREAVAQNPEAVNAKLLLASYLAQRDQAAAIEALKSFISGDSEQSPELKFALAESYVRNDSMEEAAGVYEDIANSAPTAVQQNAAKNQLARLALRARDGEQANNLIAEVLANDPRNADALIARALVALGERSTDDAITDLRLAIREKPRDDRAHLLLANAYRQNSAQELAEESLFQALEINPLNADAALMYARTRLQRGDLQGALLPLDRLASGGVRNADAENLRIQIRLMQKDWKSATDLAAGVARSTSNPAYERYILALTLFGQERYAESIEMFRSVITENPAMEGALGGVARANRAAGTPEQGIAFLREHVGAHPESLLARNLLAEELARSGDLASAEAVYREAVSAKPDAAGLYRALASLLTRDKQFEQAAQVLREGIAAVPNPLDLKLQLAMTLESLSKPEEAITLYRELLDKVPTLDVAANNLAVLVAGDGSNPERLAEAAGIAARFESSEQPWFADTLGWIYWQQKNYAKAAELLTRAAKAAPSEPLFHYHAAAALFELKDFAAARKHLEETEKLVAAGRTYPEHKDALALLARLPQTP